ncbi:RNA polymerase alpha subunit C-terminal domain-containing protein [Oceanobacillus oncorhynchi subsp. oncorhynchi]
MTSQKQRKVCKNGHVFFKSSDCESCPTCDKENKPKSGFLATLSAPARRALIHEGISTEEQLAAHTKKEILALHGIWSSIDAGSDKGAGEQRTYI